jgi:hypothetical protein
MAYIPLSLACSNTKVAAAISMATERHLKEAHFLLATTYSNESPHDHFGNVAAIMTLLTIASASAIRHFDPRANKNKKADRQSFVECVEAFFPWDCVTIADDQQRLAAQRRSAAAGELYAVFRNPLVHCGGVVGKGHRVARINHVFPGLGSLRENERVISELCGLATLDGQMLIEMAAASSTLHTRPLYWCARKMIEAFAADPGVQRNIVDSLGI